MHNDMKPLVIMLVVLIAILTIDAIINHFKNRM